jgi:hypothetical protein
VQAADIVSVPVPTADMTSDYLTKPQQGALFANMFAKIMGQEYIHN